MAFIVPAVSALIVLWGFVRVMEAKQSTAAFLLTGVPSNAIAFREWSQYPYGDMDKAVGLATTLDAVLRARRPDRPR